MVQKQWNAALRQASSGVARRMHAVFSAMLTAMIMLPLLLVVGCSLIAPNCCCFLPADRPRQGGQRAPHRAADHDHH